MKPSLSSLIVIVAFLATTWAEQVGSGGIAELVAKEVRRGVDDAFPALKKRQYGYGYGGAPTTMAVVPANTAAASPQAGGYGGGSSGGGSSDGDSDGDDDSYGGGYSSVAATQQRNFQIAHGTLMGLAFVVIFPLGGIVVRTLNSPSVAYVHGSIQAIGYAVVLAGLGVGVWLAQHDASFHVPHTVIGLVVVGLLAVQLALGILHHSMYLRTRRASVPTHLHIWLGRIVLLLGLINGGLGLQLADNTRSGCIAYGVVAGIVGVSYFVITATAKLVGSRSRRGPKVG
ncbi:MAG: hypothetical protein M1838_002291 [Thelocarpon superellum]|nr:MAG: hypothetical protein M1838_002291 [Thelocarpon superellum]